MVASERTINAIRAAAADDSDYMLLKEQIAAGWPTSPSQLPPELKPYAQFCEELVVSGSLVYKGNRVVIPRGAREDILNRYTQVTSELTDVYHGRGRRSTSPA